MSLKALTIRLFAFIRRSWKSLALIIPLILAFYYIVGGYVSHKIDRSTDFSIVRNDNAHGLSVVDAAAALIHREVDEHLWTPNLPIIFPGYILDDMPAFQTGIIRATRALTHTLQKSYKSKDLTEADELLNYPTNIWLLSKTKNLALAPSSGAQYRKARQALLRFNADPDTGHNDPRLLIDLLKTIAHRLSKIDQTLQQYVQEESSAWTDTKADNVFFNSEGRLYAYYIFLKALASDFEQTIVDADQYQNWTSMMKSFEDALRLSPTIVRNGAPDSLFAPNHLLVLDADVVRAEAKLRALTYALGKEDRNVH